MVDPVEAITNAKSGYELAVAMLAVGILGSAWTVVKFFELHKLQEEKDAYYLKQIDDINKFYVEKITTIQSDNHDRIERLIEAHRTETLASIKQLNNTLQTLHIIVEKYNRNKIPNNSFDNSNE